MAPGFSRGLFFCPDPTLQPFYPSRPLWRAFLCPARVAALADF
nr:MAG TPA: hypothetical protein [Caudoviricetes sp.]